MVPNPKWRQELAYKWCEDFGDKEHHKHHHGEDNKKEFSMWCGNCHDGIFYIIDVVKAIKERF